ncbi:MAG: transposase family protein [Deltaproteobacteria bacterium]|nr:transposase family protein [Deltaproteobacteria bacterium]
MKMLEHFRQIPDHRQGTNTMYPFTQLLMTALAAFYSKAPSLRRFLGGFFEYRGIHGVDALLSALHTGPEAVRVSRRIPTDNHIRKQLDGVEPTAFFPAVWELLDKIVAESADLYRYKGMSILVPYLGWHFASRKIRCPVCVSRVYPSERKDDDVVENFHSFVGMSLHSPGGSGGHPQLPPEFLYAEDYPDVIPGFPYRTGRGNDAPRPDLAAALQRAMSRREAKIRELDPLFVLQGPFGTWKCAEQLKGNPYILMLNEPELERFQREDKELAELALGTHPKSHKDGSAFYTAVDLYSRNLGPVLFERGLMSAPEYIRLVEWRPSDGQGTSEGRGRRPRHRPRVVFTTLPADLDRSSGLVRLLNTVQALDVSKALEDEGFGFLKKFGHGQQTLSEVFCVMNIIAVNLDLINGL